MADEVLLSDAEVSEDAEARKQRERERKRKERQKATEAKGKRYSPRLGLRKDPPPLDSDAPTFTPEPAAVEGIVPGQVGKAQERLNDETAKPVSTPGKPYDWLMRQN